MDCNVLRCHLRRWTYYLCHPLRLFKDLFLSIRWAFQRSIRGYADCDCFSIYKWIIAVLSQMFENYAKHHCGYPVEGFTDEQWTQYLFGIAEHLRNASENQEVQNNEYEESWNQIIDYRTENIKTTIDECGHRHNVFPELTEDQQEVIKKYFAREKEIFEWRECEARTALKMISDHFFSLWD